MQKNVAESANSCEVVCLGRQRESAKLLSAVLWDGTN